MKAKTRTIVSISLTKKEMKTMQLIMQAILSNPLHGEELRRTAMDFAVICDEMPGL